MPVRRAIRLYYSTIVKPAFEDALRSVGWQSWENLLRTTFLIIVALLIVRLLGGQGQMTEELRWVVATVIAFAVVLSLV